MSADDVAISFLGAGAVAAGMWHVVQLARRGDPRVDPLRWSPVGWATLVALAITVVASVRLSADDSWVLWLVVFVPLQSFRWWWSRRARPRRSRRDGRVSGR